MTSLVQVRYPLVLLVFLKLAHVENAACAPPPLIEGVCVFAPGGLFLTINSGPLALAGAVVAAPAAGLMEREVRMCLGVERFLV